MFNVIWRAGKRCTGIGGVAILSSVTIVMFVSPAEAGTTTYHYDALGRVVMSTTDNFTVEGYAYDAAGNRVTTTRSAVPPPTSADRLLPGQGLVMNTSIRSANGQYTMVLQSDGNLVVYGPSGASWAASTSGLPSAQAVLQGDGNFVVYGPTGQVYWNSQTSGHAGAVMIMQDDGNLVIYDANGAPLWALSWQ